MTVDVSTRWEPLEQVERLTNALDSAESAFSQEPDTEKTQDLDYSAQRRAPCAAAPPARRMSISSWSPPTKPPEVVSRTANTGSPMAGAGNRTRSGSR